jgi:leader peptidase (prepilin peptidase)/N-methyltransferase
MTKYQLAIAALGLLLGGSVGSFAGVVLWRVPRHQSLLRPPSHCANCGYHIPAWANVPILAWPVLRGRCHKCGARIGMRFWLLELWCAAVPVVIAITAGVGHWWLWPVVVGAWVVPTGILTFIESQRVTTH